MDSGVVVNPRKKYGELNRQDAKNAEEEESKIS